MRGATSSRYSVYPKIGYHHTLQFRMFVVIVYSNKVLRGREQFYLHSAIPACHLCTIASPTKPASKIHPTLGVSRKKSKH